MKIADLICTVALAGGVLLFVNDAHARQERDRRSNVDRDGEPMQLECPNDPYLPPPGGVDGPFTSTPALVRAGPYVSVQVNVNEFGQNILGDAANEPSMSISAADPNRIVIGWRQFDNVQSNFRQAGHAYSTDGGMTWFNRGVLDPGVFRSDPVLAADTHGNFYYNSLKGDFFADIFISSDGINWTGPIPATGGDKLWMAIDTTNGVGRDNIYCAWSTAAGCCGNNIFTRSTDGGETFLNPIALPTSPIWGTVAVGTDGAVYVSGSGTFRVIKSKNAKFSAEMPEFGPAVMVNMGGSYIFNTGPNPGGLLGQVWIAAAHSFSISDDNVYLASSVKPVGSDPLDVMFARSVNGGVTWSPPVRINNDAQTPNGWQWFTTMSVAPNGRIDVIWNDTRASQSAHISELYYASSQDAGLTWSPNIRISPQWDSFIGWPAQDKIGDYYQTVSDNAAVNIAYAATFNGEQDVYFLRAGDCNHNGVHDAVDIANGTSMDINRNGIPDECEMPPCPADTNRDGNVNVADLLTVINAWGACAGCPADINHDGQVNVADLLAVINGWGACP